MDKHIIDKLVSFGLITNVGIDASKYKDVDDLIAKGIITIPGAKSKIAELLNPVNPPLILVEETTEETPAADNITNVNESVDNTAEPVENAKVTEPTETVETVVEAASITEPEIVVEETVEETEEVNKKKSKKA